MLRGWVIFFLILSLLFVVLNIVAGTREGVLEDVVIATYNFGLNNSIVYPPQSLNLTDYKPPFPPYIYSIQSFYFGVHYLSLCAGWEGGAATAGARSIGCIAKPLGWTFRTDDPFIVNQGAENGSFPLESSDVPLEEVHTAATAATLIIGLLFGCLGLLALVCELMNLGKFDRWMKTKTLSVSTGLIALSSVFLTISAGLVTSLADSAGSDPETSCFPYGGAKLLGFTWTAIGLLYFALIGAVIDDFRKPKDQVSAGILAGS